MVRDGKAELDYLEKENRDAKIVGFRSFLDGKLNPKGEVPKTEVELPENLLPIDQLEALRESPIARKLELSQFRIENGWLYIGWNHLSDSGYQTYGQDLPAIWNEQTIRGWEEKYIPGEQMRESETAIPLR